MASIIVPSQNNIAVNVNSMMNSLTQELKYLSLNGKNY